MYRLNKLAFLLAACFFPKPSDPKNLEKVKFKKILSPIK